MSKTILITGCGSGYGNLIAKVLSEEGHGVIATMEIKDDKSRKVADDLGSTYNIEVLNIGLNNEKTIAENIRQIIHKYGAIDILINDVEITSMGLLEATSITQLKHIFDIGLFNVIRMIQAVLPDMRKNRSGIILNICCGPSLFSLPYLIPQTLSKMSVIALSEGLNVELKSEGIDCLSVLVDGCLSESMTNMLLDADLPEIAEAYKVDTKNIIHKMRKSICKHEPTEEHRLRIACDIVEVLNTRNKTGQGQIIIDTKNEPAIHELFDKKIELQNIWLERIGMKA